MSIQPQQKILNFLEEYIKSDSFQQKILRLRRDISIPDDGIPISGDDLKNILSARMRFLSYPNIVKIEDQKLVNQRLKQITEDFPVKNIQISFAFSIYFYYNKYFIELFDDALIVDNVCKLVEARNEMEEYCADIPDFSNVYLNHQKLLTDQYPIALYISPSATQRDIVEYVRKMWPLFESFSSGFKEKSSKVGKVKRKNSFIKERNEFIYKNKHLPRKKIMELLTDKYGSDKTIDYAYIGKIISLENKKRKEM